MSLLEVWRSTHSDPLRFVTEIIGAEPHPWQAEALVNLSKTNRLAIRSGHGVGKTTLIAWAGLWYVLSRNPAQVLVTANSQDQLRDVVFKNFAQWTGRLPKDIRPLIEVSAQRLIVKPLAEQNFIVGRTASPDNTESLQGFHGFMGDNIMVVLEEASGLTDPVIEVMHGALSDPHAKILALGNPTRASGFFYDVFHRLRDKWTTQIVNSEDVPTATGHISDIVARYGEDSNQYRVRVLGEFPVSDDDVVVPLHLLEAAIERKVERSNAYRTVWGCDPARFGDDRTALAKRCGNMLLEPIQWWRNLDTSQTAGKLKNEYEKTPEEDRPSEILVDEIGLGSGVVDAAYHLGLPVRGINVAETPAVKGQFQRKRDELYFLMADWFKKRNCKIPDDEGFVSELADIRYEILPNGNVKVEAKSDMKKRIGRSPDLSDAFLLTFAGGMDKIEDHTLDRYNHPKRRRRHKAWSSWAA